MEESMKLTEIFDEQVKKDKDEGIVRRTSETLKHVSKLIVDDIFSQLECGNGFILEDREKSEFIDNLIIGLTIGQNSEYKTKPYIIK
jgi:hypothetical protein